MESNVARSVIKSVVCGLTRPGYLKVHRARQMRDANVKAKFSNIDHVDKYGNVANT